MSTFSFCINPWLSQRTSILNCSIYNIKEEKRPEKKAAKAVTILKKGNMIEQANKILRMKRTSTKLLLP